MACKIGSLVIGPVATNCYYVYDDEKNEALVFVPALYGEKIYDRLKKEGLTCAAILITHGNFDHISGANDLKKVSGARVYAPALENEMLADPALNLSADGVSIIADQDVSDGDVLELGGMEITVLSTPGHTSGGCCYYFPKEKILISGDTLFCGSVGRTDLPTGSMSTLVRSIREKLMVLPDDVSVFPGHGDGTTIGEERNYNPYL